MRRSLAALAVAGIVGCSGGSLDPALSGTWTGPATIILAGTSGQTYASTLTLEVSGSSLTALGVCPGSGYGTITATGSGDSATWSGALACPPLAFTNCSNVVPKLTSASLSLGTGGLTAQAVGSVSGCGVTEAMTISLTAAKG